MLHKRPLRNNINYANTKQHKMVLIFTLRKLRFYGSAKFSLSWERLFEKLKTLVATGFRFLVSDFSSGRQPGSRRSVRPISSCVRALPFISATYFMSVGVRCSQWSVPVHPATCPLVAPQPCESWRVELLCSEVPPDIGTRGGYSPQPFHQATGS